MTFRAFLAIALVAGAIAGCKAPEKTRAGTGEGTGEAKANADANADASAGASTGADASVAREERGIGPYEVVFEGTRKVYYVVPPVKGGKHRLLGNLHGVCNPPGYSCGYWTNAGSNAGFLVCPEGNSRCGPQGPPTWTEPQAKMDDDLEKAIAVVEANHPGEISREGSVLTAFSLGSYAAVEIAKRHPGRWPYLILNEANVSLDATSLRASGVRAVALIAGENGSQVQGEKATAARLTKQGFPARLWVMKGAGHYYSGDIDTIMTDAIAFVVSHEGDGDAGVTSEAGAPR